jgi:RNA polymerase sigma-70 factor (ECF subfamily)
MLPKSATTSPDPTRIKLVIFPTEPKPAIRDELLAHAPWLRRFALSLCGTIDRAEDLVQDTFLLALTHLDSFQPGTNLAAWLVTILRNRFRDQYRRRQREAEDADGHHSGTLNSQPEQSARIEFAEFRAALDQLSPQQRQALILVGTTDLSYDDAAARCGCATGTLKSRVHRARARLIDLLAIDSTDDFGPDRTTRAVMANGRNSAWR